MLTPPNLPISALTDGDGAGPGDELLSPDPDVASVPDALLVDHDRFGSASPVMLA
jgi:hypothetical protein